MQNVQNAAEIQQRVINLVELYRTKVGKESQIAKEANILFNKWKDRNKKSFQVDGLIQFKEIKDPDKDIRVKYLQVNEQLLGHFYLKVAGKGAETGVLSQLLPDFYDTTIYSEEEESFLSSHFREMVNYISQTPNNDLFYLFESKNDLLVPKEVLELIAKQVQIPTDSVILNPQAGAVQLTSLFEDCKYLCGEQNAWAHSWLKIFAYANSINVEIIDLHTIQNYSYDVILFYLPEDVISLGDGMDSLLCHMYDNLKDGGKIILITPKMLLAKCGKNFKRPFWHKLVEGREISKIIQLPNVMDKDNYNIVIAEKNRQNMKTTFVDARFASIKGNTVVDPLSKKYWDIFDIASYDEMVRKNGKNPISGEKRMIDIDSVSVDVNMLLPEFYLLKKPANDDNPMPLSSVCNILKTKKISKLKTDLPIQTPWLKYGDLSYIYHGFIDLENIEKANCPNNPKYSEDMKSDFNESGEFIDNYYHFIINGTSKGQRIFEYRNSSYIDGKKDVVFIGLGDIGAKTAIVSKCKTPYAADIDGFMTKIYAFTSLKGVTSLELLALLRMPIVYNQIKLFSGLGDLACHLDEILVPSDERIKRDCILRLECEEKEYKDQKDVLNNMKADYISEVRMRKHDMRPHMKQLNSANNLMQHYVDNLDSTENVQEHLNHQLIRFRNALSHLSEIIDHLSDEEKFGEPERFSLIDYFEKLISESVNNNFDMAFNIDSDAVEGYLKKKLYDYINHMTVFAKAKDKESKIGEYSFPTNWSYAFIAPLDFDRMVQNILENARKHGFTDPTRTDYMIWINLSVDEKRDMFKIDFLNNGTPLPYGMTKTRYGLKGEKAGLTGETGSGGYIVKSIITHYGGDYDVFYKDGITTICIYLPIATI